MINFFEIGMDGIGVGFGSYFGLGILVEEL